MKNSVKIEKKLKKFSSNLLVFIVLRKVDKNMTSNEISKVSVDNLSGKVNEELQDKTYNARNFPCTECEKKFKERRHLENHLSSIHGIGETYYCEPCDRPLSTRDSLRTHRRKIHEGIKAKKFDFVKCQICLRTVPCRSFAHPQISKKQLSL